MNQSWIELKSLTTVSQQRLYAISAPKWDCLSKMPPFFQCTGESSGGRDGAKLSPPDWQQLKWMVNRDVAGNSLTEKGWCHQFSRLGLAALDSLPWIQQKTVETNLRLLRQEFLPCFLPLEPSNKIDYLFIFFNLAFPSTSVLIFAVLFAVLLAYSKLSLGLRDHCIQSQTALLLDKPSIQSPGWVVLQECHYYCSSSPTLS